MKTRNIIALIICISLPLLTGAVAGCVTSSNISAWYVYLNKPQFNPPNWVFGPVWTALYIFMGVALYLIWKSPASRLRSKALLIFIVQLILNFAWSLLFFYFHQTGWALFEIEVLFVSIFLMSAIFFKISRPAAYLQIPYLCWVAFAAVLNASLWYLN